MAAPKPKRDLVAEYARSRRQPKAKAKLRAEPTAGPESRARNFKDFAAARQTSGADASGEALADSAPPDQPDFSAAEDTALTSRPAGRPASPRPGRPFAERPPAAAAPSLEDMLAQIDAAEEAGDSPSDCLAIVPVAALEDLALRSLDRVFAAQSGRHPLELDPGLRDCSGARLITMTGLNGGILSSSGERMMTLEERCARMYKRPEPKPPRAKRSTGAAMMPKALQIVGSSAHGGGLLALDSKPFVFGEALMPLSLPGQAVLTQQWSRDARALPPSQQPLRPDSAGARLALPAPPVEVPQADRRTSPPALKDFGQGLKGGFFNAPKKKKKAQAAAAAALAETESVDALLARLDREAEAF